MTSPRVPRSSSVLDLWLRLRVQCTSPGWSRRCPIGWLSLPVVWRRRQPAKPISSDDSQEINVRRLRDDVGFSYPRPSSVGPTTTLSTHPMRSGLSSGCLFFRFKSRQLDALPSESWYWQRALLLRVPTISSSSASFPFLSLLSPLLSSSLFLSSSISLPMRWVVTSILTWIDASVLRGAQRGPCK